MAKKEKAVVVVSDVVDVDCSVAGQTPDQVPDVSLVLSVDRLKEYTNDIRRIVSDVAVNFVNIGYHLCEIRDDPALLSDCGYSDIYDYSQKELGFGRTSTKNFIGVSSKFAIDGELKEEYEDYSFSKLVELLPVSDDIDSYSPDMSVREIRNKKVADKALADRESFMAYFVSSVLDSFRKVGFDSVLCAPTDTSDALYHEFYGPFQVSVSMEFHGHKCRSSLSFKEGLFHIIDLYLGSSYVMNGCDDYSSCIELARKVWSLLSDESDKAAVAKAAKAREKASAPDPKKTKFESWLSLSDEEKAAAIRPDAFDWSTHDSVPFFLSPYNLYGDAGFGILSGNAYGADGRYVVIGRFVPDSKEPSKTVCVENLFCFLDDPVVKTFNVTGSIRINDSAVIERLDALAQASVDAAKPVGDSK